MRPTKKLSFIQQHSCSLSLLAFVAAVFAVGCDSQVTTSQSSSGSGGDGGNGAAGGGNGGNPQLTTSRVDLLFVIDNSRSMSDKQEILSQAVADLVRRLINPLCVDEQGLPTSPQPTAPTLPCPAGTREFTPMVDMHIGVLTSSLGGHGADACSGTSNPSENDFGQLITRSSTDGSSPPIPSWNNAGFLVWDPATPPSHDPPGETDVNTLVGSAGAMVTGAGEIGCGFESTLEAWYRFLIDPNPHQSIQLDNNTAVLTGTDQTILQQRKDFLRPDSMLTIVMLSDENDCSMRDGGQFYFAGQIYAPNTNQPYHLPPARAACATDPASDCCLSCGQPPGAGCDTSQDNCGGVLSGLDDHINLRCFDQKRRFGIDFLYPLDRYVSGLSAMQVQDREGNPQPNPLFSDLNPNDNITSVRNTSLVKLAAITGVPWQDIARRDANGNPDLNSGLNSAGIPIGGVQSAAELAQNGVFSAIAGDLATFTAPTDPFMVESVGPRSGVSPISGESIQPASAGEGASPINGHEYNDPSKSDLQYACIFPLAVPRNCGPGSTAVACDCQDPNNDDPLCVANPADGNNPTLQKYAKAYPALRQLNVLKQIGNQAAIGSVCPAQILDPSQNDFGYRPAARAIIEAMRPALN